MYPSHTLWASPCPNIHLRLSHLVLLRMQLTLAPCSFPLPRTSVLSLRSTLVLLPLLPSHEMVVAVLAGVSSDGSPELPSVLSQSPPPLLRLPRMPPLLPCRLLQIPLIPTSPHRKDHQELALTQLSPLHRPPWCPLPSLSSLQQFLLPPA